LASDEAFKDFLRRSSDVISPGNSNLESLLIIVPSQSQGRLRPLSWPILLWYDRRHAISLR